MVTATIVIAAWRAGSTLERSVRSALEQEEVDLEVVVVDDASPDRTAVVAQDLAAADARVKVLTLPENRGPAGARNVGFSNARGDWIAVLDADDAMAPGRLHSLIALGEARSADAVCDNLLIVNGRDREERPYLTGRDFETPAVWDLEFYLAHNQARSGRPSLGYLKPIFRRRFLEAKGLRYDETLRNGEDFHLMAAALAEGATLLFAPQASYSYMIEAGSISRRLDPNHAQALLSADAAFVARRGAAIGPRAVALMRSRRRRIAHLANAEAALQAMKSGRLDRAAAILARRPGAAGRFLKQLAAAASKRAIL